MTNDASAEERFAAIKETMRDPATAVNFAPMDVGSVNVDWWDPEARRYTTTDLIY